MRFYSQMSKFDAYTTALVFVPSSLGDSRDDNPCYDNRPLCTNLPPYANVQHRLLYNARGKCSLRFECSHCGLPHLSANNIQMGTIYGQRLLWRPEIARYVRRCYEPVTGRGNCDLAHADCVGIENG